MEFTQLIVDVIDVRSFSNIWYWIVLAVVWSSASHWVLGIPYDVIMRARRQGGEAYEDLRDMTRVNVNRLLYIGEVAGLLLAGLTMFFMTGLALLAIYYRLEFAQAVILIFLPLCFVGLLSLSTARLIRTEEPEGDLLFKRLIRHRFYTQLIGMISIFVTALYGMFHNLYVVPGFG